MKATTLKTKPGLKAAPDIAVAAPSTLPRDQILLAAILLVTMLFYLKGLGNGFVSDDRSLIIGNQSLPHWSFWWKSLLRDEYWFHDPANLPCSSRYRPLLLIWFWLNYQLFGLNPIGWHATMLAAHLGVVCLVFKVAERLSAQPYAALLAALMFGLLPVHAEAVVWPAGFGLVMAAGFELGAFYLLMGNELTPSKWALALGLYAAALLSHETAVAFPGLAAAYVFLLDSSGQPPWRDRLRGALVRMAPFAGEVVLYLIARRLVLGFLTSDPNAPTNDATFAQVMMTMPLVLATYLELLAVPWRPGPQHRVLFVTTPSSPDFYRPVIVLAALGLIALLAISHASRRRLYLFCIAWALIALTPVFSLSALLKDQLVHDNYLYLASLGWCVLIANCALSLTRGSERARRWMWGATAAAMALYGAGLWNVQRFWHDDQILYTRCAQVFPEAASPHIQLAIMAQQRGDLAGAERELQTALRLDPHNSEAMYHIGFVHAKMGRVKQGAAETAQGMLGRMYSHQKVEGYIAVARLYDQAGDDARSDAALRQAQLLPGGSPGTELARAGIRLAHGDAASAEAIARGLTIRYPDDPRVWYALGLALAPQGRNQEALVADQHALELAPNDPELNYVAAVALHKLGRDREALARCQTVLAEAPGDARTRALIAELRPASAPDPTLR